MPQKSNYQPESLTTIVFGKQYTEQKREKEQFGFIRSFRFKLTPQLAQQILDSANFYGNRKISRSNVNRLARAYQTGNFSTTNTIAFVKAPDGSLILINGQHTCKMIVEQNANDLDTFVFNIHEPHTNRFDEALKRLYQRYDVGKSRTGTDILKASGLHEELSFNDKQLRALKQAVTLIITEGTNKASMNTECPDAVREDIIRDYADSYLEYEQIMRNNTNPLNVFENRFSKMMNRAPVCGVGIIALQHCSPDIKPIVQKFFGDLRSNNVGDNSSPEFRLIQSYQNVTSYGGQSAIRLAALTAVALDKRINGEHMRAVECNKILRLGKYKDEVLHLDIPVAKSDFVVHL